MRFHFLGKTAIDRMGKCYGVYGELFCSVVTRRQKALVERALYDGD
jgi:hypothetical protein